MRCDWGIAWLVVAGFLSAGQAFACSCRGYGSVCDLFAGAQDFIVVEPLASGGQENDAVIPARVLEVFKGNARVDEEVKVEVGPSASCNHPMQKGERSIVVRRADSPRGHFYTSGCTLGWGASGPFNFVPLIRASLAGAKPTLTAWVMPAEDFSELEGLRVKAECGGVEHEGTFVEKGVVRIPEMAVGKCRMSLERSGRPVDFRAMAAPEVSQACGFAWLKLAAAEAPKPPPIPDESLADWRQETVVTLGADLHHVQGIDIEGNFLWVSSVDAKAAKGYLSLLDIHTGTLLKQVEVHEGKRIHAGGLQLDGDSIWLPVAEYDRDGPTTIQRRNKRTLAFESGFEVDDHIGCVAAGKDRLMGGNWDSRLVYKWWKDGREFDRHPSPSSANFQDLKLDGGILIGSGNTSRETGAIEWWDTSAWKMTRRITTGRTDRGVPFTHEGMTLHGGKLYLLPEDAPSRLFVFRRTN